MENLKNSSESDEKESHRHLKRFLSFKGIRRKFHIG